MSLPSATGLDIGAVYSSAAALPASLGQILGDSIFLADNAQVSLLAVSGAVAANDAMTFVTGNGNQYTVASVAASTANQKVIAVNDRSQSTLSLQKVLRGSDLFGTALSSGNVAWFTTNGLCKPNCVTGLTAGTVYLVSNSTTAGRLKAGVAGTDVFTNLVLLNNTVANGPQFAYMS